MAVAQRLLMPAEWTRHARTLMALPGVASQTWDDTLPRAIGEVVDVAKAISLFEPVTLLTGTAQVTDTRKMLKASGPYKVDIMSLDMNNLDPWMRDIAPTFVLDELKSCASGTFRDAAEYLSNLKLDGIDFNFNGWGAKYPTRSNTSLARLFLDVTRTCRIKAPIVAEGGAFETDGEGTLLATESSLINPNRNPGLDRMAIEEALKRHLGVSKIIWLPGAPGVDVTDCHVDALARFAAPGVILLSRPFSRQTIWTSIYEEARAILLHARDAQGRKFHLLDIPEPDTSAIDDNDGGMIASYVNYYLVNNLGLIVPKFGVPESDFRASNILSKVFPKRKIVQVKLHELPLAGGGIHCITQQIPDPFA